jgi:hypothetical protein
LSLARATIRTTRWRKRVGSWTFLTRFGWTRMSGFGQTRFLPDAFLDSVDFDRMEIEYIDPDAKKKRSKDPRNAF